MRKVSVKAICEFLWSEEKRLRLLSLKSKDVKFWELLRFSTYHSLTQNLNVFGTPHPKNATASKLNWNNIVLMLKGVFCRNPFLSIGAKKTVIVPHGRRVDGVDIYCHSLIKDLPSKDVLILYKDWRGDQYPGAYTMDQASMAFFIFYKLIRLFRLEKFIFDKMSVTDELAAAIESKFGVSLPITSDALKKTAYFKVYFFFYSCLFKWKKVETVYLTTSYVHHAIIAAAHANGVKVVELQHGIFTKYHLGYSFPVDGAKVDYVPDELRCFGQFWIDATPLAKNIQPTITRFEFFNDIIEKFSGKEKRENQILIPSQGPVAEELFPFAIEMSRNLPDKEIIYRLHPSERVADFDEKTKILNAPSNFHISSGDLPGEPNTYELMAQSKYQIGVSSTTLLEGLSLGCCIGVIDLPSSEYMETVLEKGHAFKVNSTKDVLDILDSDREPVDSSYYYV